MQQPTACMPQFRSFSPNALPQMVKNIAVEFGVHGLAFEGKFIVHNHSNVEKHNEELVSKLFDTPTYVANVRQGTSFSIYTTESSK
jgi:hypothetical protein